MIKTGGITRLKFHLSHRDSHSNTKKCPNLPSEVKQEIKQLLKQKSETKVKKKPLMWKKFELNYKAQWEEDITLSLMMTRRRRVMRMCMYPADMHPDERDEYREAVRASKASEWD